MALRPTRPADPGLTCLVTIAAAAIVATPHVVQLRRDGFEAMLAQLHDCAVYSRVVIRVDYFHDGFVRRGLSGTLLALLPVSPQRQVFSSRCCSRRVGGQLRAGPALGPGLPTARDVAIDRYRRSRLRGKTRAGYTPYNDVNLAAREFIAAHWPNTVHSLEEWLTRSDAAWLLVVYPLELRPEGELLVAQERRYRGRRGSDLTPDEPGVKAHAHPRGGVAREADIDASS